MSKIVVLVGLPGSGKSTWAAKYGSAVLSSDKIREMLADNADDQTIHMQVFATMRYLLRQRLAVGRPVTYLDATHLTTVERCFYVQIARWYGCALEAVVFDVPLNVCMARNRSRHRVVPEDVIRAMAERMTMPTPEEGFHTIEVIRL